MENTRKTIQIQSKDGTTGKIEYYLDRNLFHYHLWINGNDIGVNGGELMTSDFDMDKYARDILKLEITEYQMSLYE